ncbi:hypothetical protein [Tranquillimonas rosea]|uniref:hypothetical protein n=1 Tax=Tranquillimonas rosea TaxID=641238 RepID=UPI003BAA850C
MGLTFQNRGLTIAETDYSYLDEGAYAVIFADKAVGRIVKVFKRRLKEAHVRSVFRAEIDAYDLAASSTEISDLIPGNFQIASPRNILDSHGANITDEFFPDLAFQTDFVEGYFHKIGVIGGAEASRIRQLFRRAGICHTSDMSVTIGPEGCIRKAIDFATVEYELTHDE